MFTLHMFAGFVCVLLDSVVCVSSYLISGAASFELQSTRRQGPSSQDEVCMLRVQNSPFKAPSWRWGWRAKFVDKIGVLSAWRFMI